MIRIVQLALDLLTDDVASHSAAGGGGELAAALAHVRTYIASDRSADETAGADRVTRGRAGMIVALQLDRSVVVAVAIVVVRPFDIDVALGFGCRSLGTTIPA